MLDSALQWIFLTLNGRASLHLTKNVYTSVCLFHVDSSFSEHFYGLERVQEGAGGTQRLSTKQMSVSFVCLVSRYTLVVLQTLAVHRLQVIVPYLKVKVERLHSVLTDENETLGMWAWQDCRTLTQLLKLLLFKSTPYLQSLWTVSIYHNTGKVFAFGGHSFGIYNNNIRFRCRHKCITVAKCCEVSLFL